MIAPCGTGRNAAPTFRPPQSFIAKALSKKIDTFPPGTEPSLFLGLIMPKMLSFALQTQYSAELRAARMRGQRCKF
jgi:hypothetical protein